MLDNIELRRSLFRNIFFGYALQLFLVYHNSKNKEFIDISSIATTTKSNLWIESLEEILKKEGNQLPGKLKTLISVVVSVITLDFS